MQEIRVQSLVQEEHTCHEVIKPMNHMGLCSSDWEPKLLSPRTLELMLHNKRRYFNEKSVHCNWRVGPACHSYREKACAAMKTQCSQK